MELATASMPSSVAWRDPFRTHCIRDECSGYGMGHAWVTEDASMRVKHVLCINNNNIYGEDLAPVKCI